MWEGRTHLAFAVRPEIRHHADDVVQPAVGALVDEQRAQGAQRVHDQAGLDAAVQPRAREEGERPLPREADDAQEEVYNLENGEGLDGRVEVLGQKVPEDLGPEEGLERGGYLVCGVFVSLLFGWFGRVFLWDLGSGDLHAAAVKTISLAQWFLINLPMVM